MGAVAGGLTAAVLWAVAGMCSSTFGRRASPFVGVAIANVVGAAVATAAALAIDGVPRGAAAADWGWSTLYGLALGAALACAFWAIANGPVGLVAPIISCEGAIAALVSVGTGEHLQLAAGVGLIAIAIGIVVSVVERTQFGIRAVSGRRRTALIVAGFSAILFAGTLLTSSRATGLDPLWVVATGRAVGVLTISVPVLLRLGGPGRPTRLWWLLVLNGVADVVAFAAFVEGSRSSVAIASVLGSEYAVVMVLFGVVAFRERLAPWQWAGVATTLAGVGVVAASQA